MVNHSKSGRIWLADGGAHYASHDYGSWRIPVGKMQLLGEYTTDHGPFLGDWFLVFVTDSDGSWYEASFYAEDRHVFLPQLANLLGTNSAYGELAESTEFASRIIWPNELCDQPLFDFTPVPVSLWRRVLRIGIHPIHMQLTTEAILSVSQ